jgi:hypothetical protein
MGLQDSLIELLGFEPRTGLVMLDSLTKQSRAVRHAQHWCRTFVLIVRSHHDSV